MENEFTTYEQALALKELGFDEPCIGWYNPQVNYKEVTTDKYWAFHLTGEWENFKPAPTFSQGFKWFREKHGLIGLPRRDPSRNYNGWWFEIFEQKIKSDNPISLDDSDYINFDTYEEAELECLKQLIKVVKEKT